MTLPTREEIAALIEKHVIGHFQAAGQEPYAPSALACADALLARLRPGWAELEEAYGGQVKHTDSIRSHFLGLLAEQDKKIDALRADLKAVAEALARLYTYPGVRDVLAPIESLGSIAADVEEALSKPGVQAGLK